MIWTPVNPADRDTAVADGRGEHKPDGAHGYDKSQSGNEPWAGWASHKKQNETWADWGGWKEINCWNTGWGKAAYGGNTERWAAPLKVNMRSPSHQPSDPQLALPAKSSLEQIADELAGEPPHVPEHTGEPPHLALPPPLPAAPRDYVWWAEFTDDGFWRRTEVWCADGKIGGGTYHCYDLPFHNVPDAYYPAAWGGQTVVQRFEAANQETVSA